LLLWFAALACCVQQVHLQRTIGAADSITQSRGARRGKRTFSH